LKWYRHPKSLSKVLKGPLRHLRLLGSLRFRCGIVHNVAVGPVEIFLILVAVAFVAYVVWRLVVRPRR
jgi:hypothetical protein